jgi:hypothetical protein
MHPVDREGVVDLLASKLEVGDREPFRQAAEAALAALPVLGDGVVHRTLVPLWNKFFHPPTLSPEPHAERSGRRPKNDKRLKVIEFENQMFRSRDALACHLAGRVGRSVPAVAMALAKHGDDGLAVIEFYSARRACRA